MPTSPLPTPLRIRSTLRLAVPFLVVGLLSLVGCGASQTEVDQLKRRVATLEKRVRVLEGGGGRVTAPKGKSKRKRRRRRNRRRPQPTPDGSVVVTGDAVKVVLEADGKRHPVPGTVPEMAYSILASFEEGQPLVKVGSMKVAGDKTTTLKCVAAQSICEPSAVE